MDKKDMIATVACPYCGTQNKIGFSKADRSPQAALCDLEVGGCDRYFVFRPIITITAEVWTMAGVA